MGNRFGNRCPKFVVGIQVQYLVRRPADRDIGFEITAAALDLLGEAGFDPVYGARPLRRAVQSRLENQLAQKILGGEYGPGDTIRIDASQGELTFGQQAASEAA